MVWRHSDCFPCFLTPPLFGRSSNCLPNMSRLLALRALQDLSLDLQKLIFKCIYPTKNEISSRLEAQHPVVWEFHELDWKVVNFVHDGERYLEFPLLSRAERKWVHLRCEAFHLTHKSIVCEGGRILVIAKGPGWVYDQETELQPFEWSTASFQRQEDLFCKTCGKRGYLAFGDAHCDSCFAYLRDNDFLDEEL